MIALLHLGASSMTMEYLTRQLTEEIKLPVMDFPKKTRKLQFIHNMFVHDLGAP